MQRLLRSAVADDGGLRDDLRDYVVENLGDPGAVLVVDETGDVKKGTATAGVQRQYTGTAGRIENAQVAVYLAYAAARGYAFIDRALYLPRSWTGDPARCRAADVPADTEFATRPALAGDGAKGPRLYDWAYIETTDPALPGDGQGASWLLIRRPLRTAPATKTQYAFYRAHAPGPLPLRALVAVAGTRWKVEEGFAGKELTALDQHQVRSRASWMRWAILALLAHAFLSVMTAAQPGPGPGDVHRDEAGHELIPLTRNEIRRLLAGLPCRPRPARDQLHWSRWRRHHQATARNCRYQRRQALAVT